MNILCICLSPAIQRTLLFAHFSPAAVNRTNNYREDTGGKSINSARVLNQAFAGSADILCPLGTENASEFIKLAKRDNITVIPIYIPGKIRECWTLLSENGETTEIVCDAPAQKDKKRAFLRSEKKILRKIENLCTKYDAFLVAGSTPASFSTQLLQKICMIVQAKKKLLLVDFHGTPLLNTLTKVVPQIIKINEAEFTETFFPDEKRTETFTEKELETRILKKSTELQNTLIITRGTEPTITASNGTVFTTKIEKTNCVNTTGCGDAFNAGILLSLLQENNLITAVHTATHFAALNASHTAPGCIKDT